MLRHNHVAHHHKIVAEAHRLERVFEQVACGSRTKVRVPFVTTKGHEVHIAGLLKSHQTFRHPNIVPLQMRCIAFPGLRSETWGTQHFLYTLLARLPHPAPHHPMKHGVHGLRRFFFAAIEPPAQ